MAKEKLPFELQKPDSNTFVTQADQIGHNGKALSATINEVVSNIDSFEEAIKIDDNEEVYLITDSNHNIIARIDNNGLATPSVKVLQKGSLVDISSITNQHRSHINSLESEIYGGKAESVLTPTKILPGQYIYIDGSIRNSSKYNTLIFDDVQGRKLNIYIKNVANFMGINGAIVSEWNGDVFAQIAERGNPDTSIWELDITPQNDTIYVTIDSTDGTEYLVKDTNGFVGEGLLDKLAKTKEKTDKLVADFATQSVVTSAKISNLESQISEIGGSGNLELTPSDTYEGRYVSAADGSLKTASTRTVQEFVVSEGDNLKILIHQENVATFIASGGSMIALYNGTNYVKSVKNGDASQADYDVDVTIPTGVNILRVTGSNGSGSFIKVTKIVPDRVQILRDEVDAIKSQGVSGGNTFDGKLIVKSGEYILGLGASFMRGNAVGSGNNNSWLHTMASSLGCNVINDALGGTNICYHANRLYDGTILGESKAPISDVAAILIMHAHEKDVYTLDSQYQAYSVSDYESSGMLPFSVTTGTDQDDSVYAMAFDYVIKKIFALYNAQKTEATYVSALQKYMGAYVPKPCQIALATHWHDARSKYNDSIRKLAKKWGFPLVRFDDKIGFTKSQPNPVTGYQASLEYVGNDGGASAVESIGGVAYGWHPMCGNADVYIQRKMAAIAKQTFEVI